MGFFDRVRQVLRGKASNTMAEMESRNPEAVYEAAIIEREKKYVEMKKAASELAVLRKRNQDELERAQRELNEIGAQIEVAVGGGDDEIALVLLEKKQSLSDRSATLEAEIDTLNGQVEEITGGLRAFQAEIEKLKREKSEMVSRKSNAEAQLQIQNTLSGLSTESDVKGLANVRENIERLAVDADLDTSSAQRVTTQRLKQSRAAAQLAELKRQMQSKSAAPSTDAAAGEGASDASAGTEPAAPPSPDTPKRTL